jgi:hypothetical protein
MPKPNIDAPSWLRQMENILEELNEGVAASGFFTSRYVP